MNLDDFTPEWEQKRIYSPFYDCKLGVRTSSLNDWRKIERLYSKVNLIVKNKHNLYWSTLENWSKSLEGKEIWWIDPTKQFVNIYNDKSISSRYLPEFIKQLIPDTKYHGYKLSCDETKKIQLLELSLNTHHHRKSLIYNYFLIAIQNRLNNWIKKSKYHIDTPVTVIVKNDNRLYTIKISRNCVESIVQPDELFE